MKVGDLVRFKSGQYAGKWKRSHHGKVFLVMRTRLASDDHPNDQEVWIYPDPEEPYAGDDNYYFASGLEVISESR